MLDDRSYERSIKQLQEKATELSPLWSKFDQEDIGITLITLLASQSHVVDFYTKYYLENLYLPNNNSKYIYEMLGYKPSSEYTTILSVRVDWTDCGPDDFIYFPKYTTIEMETPKGTYEFLTTKDYYLREYSPRVIMDMVYGELIRIELKSEEIQNNRYLISEDPIEFETVTFTIDGTPWAQVDNIHYESDGCFFSVHKEEDGNYLYLQDNWRDFIPSEEASDIVIEALKIPSYLATNDLECVGLSFTDPVINAQEQDITENFILHLMDNVPVTPEDREDFGNSRIITLDDFEYQAMMFSEVATAKAYDWDTYSPELGLNDPYKIKVVANGPTSNLSPQVKSSMRRRLQSMTFEYMKVDVVDPNRVRYSALILANIGDYKGTYQEAEIYQSIRRGIDSYFTPGNIEIGDSIDTKELFSIIYQEDSRIRYLEWSGFEDAIQLGPMDLPTLGELNVDFDVEAELIFDLSMPIDIAYYGPVGTDRAMARESTPDITISQHRRDGQLLIDSSVISDKHLIARDSTFTGGLDTVKIVLSLDDTMEIGSSLEAVIIDKS